METDKRVQILLSTYNGERYLREQLDSIVGQTAFQSCSVLIRDDGSSDKTVEILKEYEDNYGFQVYSGSNLGVNGSYQWLLDHADLSCDYFALSDQDDIWMPDKIERAFAALDGSDDSVPVLFATCSLLTNAQMEPIGTSLHPKKGVSFYNAMLQNVCPGHTQVFNRRLLSMARGQSWEDMIVLDWWNYLLASGAGTVLFDDALTVKHRQHGDNAIGYGTSFLKLFLPRLKRVLAGEGYKMGRQLDCFSRLYGSVLRRECKEELDAFLSNLPSFRRRILYLNKSRVYRQTKLETMIFRVLYLAGKYRFKE